MSTSGTVVFATNRDAIIYEAYKKISMIGEYDTLTSQQIATGAFNLNMLVKALQADGMPLWALKNATFPLVQGQVIYPIGTGLTINVPRPLRIINAFGHDSNTAGDLPMTIVTREEYDRLGNKTSQGTPVQIYYDPQLLQNTPAILVYPCPDLYSQTYRTIQIRYQRPFEDFNASTDEPDFPQEWYLAVVYLLALILAPNSGLSLPERGQLANEADKWHQMALSQGIEEGSIYFEPDLHRMQTAE